MARGSLARSGFNSRPPAPCSVLPALLNLPPEGGTTSAERPGGDVCQSFQRWGKRREKSPRRKSLAANGLRQAGRCVPSAAKPRGGEDNGRSLLPELAPVRDHHRNRDRLSLAIDFQRDLLAGLCQADEVHQMGIVVDGRAVELQITSPTRSRRPRPARRA